MQTKLTILLPLVLLCLMSLTVFAQATQSHTVYFKEIDGFSGRVEFTSSREGFATQLRGKNATLFITNYKCSDGEKAALKKAGFNLWSATNIGYQPKTFGVIVQGKAYVREVYYYHESVSNDKLHLNQGLGDFTTPKFEEEVETHAKEYQRIHKKSYWEDHGGFNAKEVTTLYLSDLKTEIQRILYEHKQEKEQKEAEQKEKAEKEKQEAAAKEQESKSGSGSSASNKEKDKSDKQDDEKEDSDKKETKKATIYIPKTNQQLYNELEAMTKANPGMLNDPTVRKRLRDYKSLANRDDNNRAYYKAASYEGYNPVAMDAYASAIITNQNIATAEMVVGDVVDAATGIVNSIIADNNRRERERIAERERQRAQAEAEKKAFNAYHLQLSIERDDYNEAVKTRIQHDYVLIESFLTEKVTFTANGKTEQLRRRNFQEENLSYGYYHRYKVYTVEQNGVYGILGDSGEPIYPPQFTGMSVISDKYNHPHFLVKLKDKWGEINYDGTIIEEIKYDGIWYTPNAVKVMKLGNQWIIKTYGSETLKEARLTSEEVKEKFPGGILPVTNTLQESYSYLTFSYVYFLLQLGKEQLYNFGNLRTNTGRVIANNTIKIPFKITTDRQSTKQGKIFQLEEDWYELLYDKDNGTISIQELPKTFVIPVCREFNNKFIWGAINQDNKIIIPLKHKYIKKLSGNHFETDKGIYDNQGIIVK